MNDIEILEEFKSRTILYSDVYAIHIEELKKIQRAIQNILKERQADKEKIKELEKQNRELNILKLIMLVGEFPDTTETYKKYKKELDELLETH